MRNLSVCKLLLLFTLTLLTVSCGLKSQKDDDSIPLNIPEKLSNDMGNDKNNTNENSKKQELVALTYKIEELIGISLDSTRQEINTYSIDDKIKSQFEKQLNNLQLHNISNEIKDSFPQLKSLRLSLTQLPNYNYQNDELTFSFINPEFNEFLFSMKGSSTIGLRASLERKVNYHISNTKVLEHLKNSFIYFDLNRHEVILALYNYKIFSQFIADHGEEYHAVLLKYSELHISKDKPSRSIDGDSTYSLRITLSKNFTSESLTNDFEYIINRLNEAQPIVELVDLIIKNSTLKVDVWHLFNIDKTEKEKVTILLERIYRDVQNKKLYTQEGLLIRISSSYFEFSPEDLAIKDVTIGRNSDNLSEPIEILSELGRLKKADF